MRKEKGRFLGLLPLLVFILVYLVVSLVVGDFYKMPVLVAFMFSAIVAFLQFPRLPFREKINEFTAGAGDPGIMLMILIFLLAGAFAGLSKSIGAVESTVNFALSYISPQLLIAGLFITASFISLSLGTSVGTIVALAPIAAGINESVTGSLAVSLAAVVGGAMFGDNLSMISDTTIAATRTQGVSMRDKFKMNFWIVLPATIITLLLYSFIIDLPDNSTTEPQPYSFLKIVPYLFIFMAAIAGMHVIWVLISGIFLTSILGLFLNNTDIWLIIESLNKGMASMFELSVICLVIGGIIGLINYYGGINYLLYTISRFIRGSRSGELGIAFLTSVVNVALANNTITILIVGPLAKKISQENNIDPRRTASILDTMSCFVQGLLPYGAQLLAAMAVAGKMITPFDIMKYLYYPYLLGISIVVYILISKRNHTTLPAQVSEVIQ